LPPPETRRYAMPSIGVLSVSLRHIALKRFVAAALRPDQPPGQPPSWAFRG